MTKDDLRSGRPSDLERLAKTGLAARGRKELAERRAAQAACGRPTTFIGVMDRLGGAMNEKRREGRTGRREGLAELWDAVRGVRSQVNESEGRLTHEIRQGRRESAFWFLCAIGVMAVGVCALGLMIWSS